ncbi:MAG: hypothetical protein ACRDJ4_04460 [Actinomycetota bacterium]
MLLVLEADADRAGGSPLDAESSMATCWFGRSEASTSSETTGNDDGSSPKWRQSRSRKTGSFSGTEA